jgi:hypothetical protein
MFISESESSGHPQRVRDAGVQSCEELIISDGFKGNQAHLPFEIRHTSDKSLAWQERISGRKPTARGLKKFMDGTSSLRSVIADIPVL